MYARRILKNYNVILHSEISSETTPMQRKNTVPYCVQENEFSDKQCKALLKLEKPLDAIFQHYEKHGRSRMPDLYDAVDGKANTLLREEFLKRRQQAR